MRADRVCPEVLCTLILSQAGNNLSHSVDAKGSLKEGEPQRSAGLQTSVMLRPRAKWRTEA